MLMFEGQEMQEECEITTEKTYSSYEDAQLYIDEHNLEETHQVWRTGKEWYVRPKDYRPNKKVAKYEDDNHISELRRRMAAIDPEEAKVICEVMARSYPEIYIDKLNEYVKSIRSYNSVIETLVESMDEDDRIIFGEV